MCAQIYYIYIYLCVYVASPIRLGTEAYKVARGLQLSGGRAAN